MALNVATWDGVIGGPESPPVATVTPDSQLNFAVAQSTFGDYLHLMPSDGGWLLLNLHLWPTIRRTDSGDTSVLDEIIAGTHNTKLRLLGTRLKAAFVALGHPISRLVICPCSEANRRGPFQVFSSTTGKWQGAVSRCISEIKTGAAEANLRFMMVVGRTPNIGGLANWLPTNIDAIGMPCHPGIGVNTQAKLNSYLDGSLDGGYGFTTDIQNFSVARGIPMALPKWGPGAQWGATPAEQLACPIADLVVNDVWNKLVNKYQDRFLCDLMYEPALLNPTGYQGPDAAGIAAWTRASAAYKTLWSGTKSAASVAPVNTVPPIVTGSTVPGSLLTSTDGVWTGGPISCIYQWKREAVNISGATANTYTTLSTDAGKSIYCRVTAKNTAGSTAQNSNTVVIDTPVSPIGNSSLMMNGLFYGIDRPADAAANYDYHYREPQGVRFRAELTGSITGVRWNNRYSTDADGYSKGNGGVIRIEIRKSYSGVLAPPDAPGSGAAKFDVLPAGHADLLGRTADIPSAKTIGDWPSISFQNPVPVTAGTLYWCVFNQLDTSNNNWISTNSDDTKGYVAGRRIVPGGPYWNDSWVVTISNGTTWNPGGGTRDYDQGIQMMRCQFRYKLSNGTEIWSGSSTIFAHGNADVPTGSHKNFNDTNKIRMQFTPKRPTFTTSKLWWRAYRHVDSPAAGIMNITLKKGATVVGSWTSASSNWVISKADNTLPPPIPMVAINLGTAITIETGQQYYLEFGAASGNYHTHAQQESSRYRARNNFLDGYAQYWTGSAWRGWGISGVDNRTDMILPFMFEVSGP